MLTETEKLKRKQKYQEKRALGLCNRCGNKVDIDGIYCSKCSFAVKETRKRYRQKKINNNKCLTCNEEPIKGQRYCKIHSENQKRLRVNLHSDRSEKGLCKRCGDFLSGKSAWYCMKCNELKNIDDKKSYEKKKEKGLCVSCGKEALRDSIYCKIHRTKVYKANQSFYLTDKGKLFRQVYSQNRRINGSSISIEIIEYMLNKYGKYCIYCNNDLEIKTKDSHFKFTIDHLKPVAKGGTNDPDNLVPACRHHNSQKGKKDLDEYLAEYFPETQNMIMAKIK